MEQRLRVLASHVAPASQPAAVVPAPHQLVALATVAPIGGLTAARAVAQHAVSQAGAVPSLAVAVSQYGETLWEEAFGWAKLGVARATTRDTLYSLASVSKPYTASALMMLVEQGILELDRPINDFLDSTAQIVSRAAPATEATVRRVANHSSGLPLHFNMHFASEAAQRSSSDETIRRYGSTITRPGEMWQYSNLGYGCLDNIIGRHCGHNNGDDAAWGRFLVSKFLTPLGLKRTVVEPVAADHPLYSHLATRYSIGSVHQQGTMGELEDYESDTPGASSVWASVHDVLRFGEFHCRASADSTRIWKDDVSSNSSIGEAMICLSLAARREMQRSTTHMPVADGSTGGCECFIELALPY